MPKCGPARLVKILTVTCEGSALASKLAQRGQYDWSNPWIMDERFLILPHAPVASQLELFQFDHDPSWAAVLAERTRRNLGEPTYEHGLYLGIQHPDEQRQYPIVVTHQPVQAPDGRSRVLVLRADAGARRLYLLCPGYRWDRGYVFAGVRKAA